jgi:RHS repeat-associated protein
MGRCVPSEEEYDYGQISSTSQCPQAAEGGTITAPTTAPTRETVTTYYDSFANAPATVKIYLNGASGTLESETDYSYDQSSTSSASAINHDGTNYGPSSTIPRANATTVVRKCLQSAPACSSGNPTTTYSYDETGQVTSMKDPNGNTTQYSHADSYTSGTPPGQTNAYLTKETNALGYFTSFAYGYSDGQLTRYTDLNTQITNYTYNTPPSGCTFPDGWDRLSQVKYPDGGTTSYCYNDAAYNPSTPSPSVTTTKKINSASNYVSTAAFDGTGHTVSTILSSDPSGTDYVDTTYDRLGHVYTVTNPFRTTSDPTYATNTYTYDALGRVTKINYFGGSASSFNDSYTYSGRAVQSVHLVNAGNFTKVSQSDALGRLTSVCEVTGAAQMGSQNPAACGQDIAATGFLTSYIYDALGDLLTVNNAVNFGQARSFTYDSLSRLTSSQNPELFENVVTYTYDALGDLAQKVAPAPNQTGSATVTTTYSYDALERPTGVSYSDGKTPTSNFEYDQSSIFGVTLTNPIGRLTSRWISGGANTGGGQEENLGYDPMGRIAFSMQCTPETCGWAAFGFNYAYDLLGDLLTSSNGNGITWTNTYNAAAQLQQTATNVLTPTTSGDLISGILYNALGKPTSSLLGNTLAESWGYDGSGGVTSYSMGSVYNFSAVNDLGGLIWAANDSVNGNWTYTYDGFERLSTSTQAGGAAFGYAYDSVGNRWQQNVTAGSGPAPQYTFGPYNHVNSGNGIAYDSAGNETGDGIHNYTYDAENRLIQVDTPGTGYTYVYDTVGRRVGKYNDQISNEYLYDLQNHAVTNLVAAAASSAGVICSNCGTLNTQSSDIYLGGRHLGLYYNNTTYFTAQNWLGTLRARTGIDGNVLETCTSLPFGDSQNCVSSDGEPGSVDRVHFTGKERDSESGLDNFEARYDASSMGRFMTPDPMGGHLENPQSLNKYAYVLNNPTSLTDPTGLDSYLSCTQTKDNASTCQSQTVGYDANGKAQTATVQGVTNADKSFTATQIGNDANGNLVDKTTGTGSYTASANGSGVQFSNNGGQTSSSGVFVNGTPQNTFQDAGFANGGALSGFTFTLTNSKLEAGQTEAGSFTFAGTPDQAGAALQKAGFNPRSGENVGMNEYRSPGSFWTGANSSHFNVFQIGLKPWLSVPQAQGDMHFGEHNPYSPFGWVPHSSEANQ